MRGRFCSCQTLCSLLRRYTEVHTDSRCYKSVVENMSSRQRQIRFGLSLRRLQMEARAEQAVLSYINGSHIGLLLYAEHHHRPAMPPLHLSHQRIICIEHREPFRFQTLYQFSLRIRYRLQTLEELQMDSIHIQYSANI